MSLATPFFPFPLDIPSVMYIINKSKQSPTISTNFQNIVSIISKLFRKPDVVSPRALISTNAPPTFSNPTIIEKPNNIKYVIDAIRLVFKKPEIQPTNAIHYQHTFPINNVLSVIIKLFEKPPETLEPKRKWPNMLDFFKEGKRNRKTIKYEPDYNAEKCMNLLEGNPLKELYEPINTYQDESAGIGVCVFKLKNISKEDEYKLSEDDKKKRSEAEETVKIRYRLEE